MKWQRRNELLNHAISQECANEVSDKKISQKLQLSASTVERQLHRHHAKLLREQLNYPCPIVPGIDERSLHRLNRPETQVRRHPGRLTQDRIDEALEGKGSTLQKFFAKNPAIESVCEFKKESCSLLNIKE